MFAVPQPVKSVSHPLIKGMYLKKDFHRPLRNQDVLVIETINLSQNNYENASSFDSALSGLLMDLEMLKKDVEREVGPFDRVDIRTH